MIKPFIMSAIASAASFAEIRVFMIVSSNVCFYTAGFFRLLTQSKSRARPGRSVKSLFLKELFF
jgi:hypothetical protein